MTVRSSRQRRARKASLRANKGPAAVLSGVALAVLAGCGQKGPLVLPDDAASGGPTGAASSSANDARADEDDDETENRADGR